MRKIVLSSVFILAISYTFAQNGISREEFVGKLREIRSAVQELPASTSSFQALITETITVINNGLLRTGSITTHLPKSYANSFDKLLSLITAIKGRDTIKQKEMLSIVCRDLKLKLQPLPNQLGDRLFTSYIDVKVIAMHSGQIASGLRVRYSFLGFEIDYSKPDQTSMGLTSPCLEKMLPGYYEIWITKPGDYQVLQTWKGEIDQLKNNEIKFNF